jgi:hypothetical protein
LSQVAQRQLPPLVDMGANGREQKSNTPSPPEGSAQQSCPEPPHETQLEPSHTALVAVQLSPLQHDWPSPPQVPHAPLLQVPRPPVHDVPLALQLLPTQQPPLSQELPSQQGWLVPPQVWHESELPPPLSSTQVVFDAEHNEGVPSTAGGQQVWPTPVPPQPPHDPMRPHVVVPQLSGVGTLSLTQVRVVTSQQTPSDPSDAGAQTLSAQQGWPCAPHALQVPFKQTLVVAVLAPAQLRPLGTQLSPLQQPPSLQVELAQQGWPTPPQVRQPVAVQTLPVLQAVPGCTQWPPEQPHGQEASAQLPPSMSVGPTPPRSGGETPARSSGALDRSEPPAPARSWCALARSPPPPTEMKPSALPVYCRLLRVQPPNNSAQRKMVGPRITRAMLTLPDFGRARRDPIDFSNARDLGDIVEVR